MRIEELFEIAKAKIDEDRNHRHQILIDAKILTKEGYYYSPFFAKEVKEIVENTKEPINFKVFL